MYSLPEFWKEIDVWKEVYEEFLDYGLKPDSAIAYTKSLIRLCEYAQVSDPYALLELGVRIF